VGQKSDFCILVHPNGNDFFQEEEEEEASSPSRSFRFLSIEYQPVVAFVAVAATEEDGVLIVCFESTRLALLLLLIANPSLA